MVTEDEKMKNETLKKLSNLTWQRKNQPSRNPKTNNDLLKPLLGNDPEIQNGKRADDIQPKCAKPSPVTEPTERKRDDKTCSKPRQGLNKRYLTTNWNQNPKPNFDNKIENQDVFASLNMNFSGKPDTNIQNLNFNQVNRNSMNQYLYDESARPYFHPVINKSPIQRTQSYEAPSPDFIPNLTNISNSNIYEVAKGIASIPSNFIPSYTAQNPYFENEAPQSFSPYFDNVTTKYINHFDNAQNPSFVANVQNSNNFDNQIPHNFSPNFNQTFNNVISTQYTNFENIQNSSFVANVQSSSFVANVQNSNFVADVANSNFLQNQANDNSFIFNGVVVQLPNETNHETMLNFNEQQFDNIVKIASLNINETENSQVTIESNGTDQISKSPNVASTTPKRRVNIMKNSKKQDLTNVSDKNIENVAQQLFNVSSYANTQTNPEIGKAVGQFNLALYKKNHKERKKYMNNQPYHTTDFFDTPKNVTLVYDQPKSLTITVKDDCFINFDPEASEDEHTKPEPIIIKEAPPNGILKKSKIIRRSISSENAIHFQKKSSQSLPISSPPPSSLKRRVSFSPEIIKN